MPDVRPQPSPEPWLVIAGDRVHASSDAAAMLLGQPAAALVSRAWLELSPPLQADDRASGDAWRERRDAASAGLPQAFPWRLLRADAVAIDVLVYLSNDNADGRLRAVLRDVTGLRAAERALRESQAQLQQIADHTPAVVFAKDRDGRYLFANREFSRLAQRPPASIVGRRDAELFASAVARTFATHDREVLDARRAIEFEETVDFGDGARTYLSQKFPLLAGDGAAYAVCGIANDITGRKRVEDALREAALAMSTLEGDAIFDALVRRLATILDVDAAFVATFVDDARTIVRTEACVLDGRLLKRFEYPIAGSPCEQVVGRAFRFLGDGANVQFPPGTMFREIGMDAYAALPLSDAHGAPIGLVAVLDREPMQDGVLVESMLKIFAARAAAEIDRRRAVSARDHSEASYRSIFEASEDAIFVHDWDTGAILDVSPAAARLYGWPVEALRTLGVGDISAADEGYDAERARERIELAKSGEPIRFEWRGRRRDGSTMWNEVRLKPATIAGRPRVLAFVRDITAAKEAGEQLRASEERYRLLFEMESDAIVLVDASTLEIVDANAAAERLWGYGRAELVTMKATDLSVETTSTVESLRGAEGSLSIPLRWHRRKDGTVFPCEITANRFMLGGRRIVLATIRDIAERREREEALARSEAKLRATVEAAFDCVIGMDGGGRIVAFNQAAERTFGYRRDEVLGRPMAELLGASPGDVSGDGFLAAIRDGIGRRIETTARRAGGAPFPVELAIGVAHAGGEDLFVGYLRDISDRRDAERQRAELEAQLRQAQKMEALGHLTGGIAHDFNNLLTTIMGYVALAAEHPTVGGDARLARFLDQATRSCERARDLIQQMLAFGRNRRIEPAPLAVGPIVKESLKLLRASIPSAIDIRVAVDERSPSAMLDPVQLEQVLMNLVINARDALPSGGTIDVRVEAAEIADGRCASCGERFDGRFVEVSVSDSGPGIPPEVRRRMFEPFFTTKDAGRGSGMGLATVHGIVHGHGGHVEVASEPSRGASFRVLLPALARDTSTVADGRRDRRGDAPTRRPLRGSVLVVDDEAPVRAYMRDLLESFGLAVDVAEDPAAAMQRIASGDRFDVVLTDQSMPGMTGIELAARLHCARPALPILLYTGHAEGLSEEMLARAGVEALIHKPVDAKRLHEVLSRRLPS